MKALPLITLAAWTGLAAVPAAHAALVSFEDVVMPNEQSYSGPGGGRYWSGLVPPANGQVDSQFVSGNASFPNTNNECCGGATFWSGFAYSNTTDTTTAGFGNQVSAFAGGGAGGSANYAIAFAGAFNPLRLSFDSPTTLKRANLTNTTYAALSMRDGDSFAKRFGGVSGDDPDYLLLTITGKDANDDDTGTVDFYLADFRFADNADDYILDSWAAVELSTLGAVTALEFTMTTTDVGQFGPNTPFYFAIDNIEPVPLPSAVWVFAPALGWLAAAGKRRKHGVIVR